MSETQQAHEETLEPPLKITSEAHLAEVLGLVKMKEDPKTPAHLGTQVPLERPDVLTINGAVYSISMVMAALNNVDPKTFQAILEFEQPIGYDFLDAQFSTRGITLRNFIEKFGYDIKAKEKGVPLTRNLGANNTAILIKRSKHETETGTDTDKYTDYYVDATNSSFYASNGESMHLIPSPLPDVLKDFRRRLMKTVRTETTRSFGAMCTDGRITKSYPIQVPVGEE